MKALVPRSNLRSVSNFPFVLEFEVVLFGKDATPPIANSVRVDVCLHECKAASLKARSELQY